MGRSRSRRGRRGKGHREAAPRGGRGPGAEEEARLRNSLRGVDASIAALTRKLAARQAERAEERREHVLPGRSGHLHDNVRVERDDRAVCAPAQEGADAGPHAEGESEKGGGEHRRDERAEERHDPDRAQSRPGGTAMTV